MVCFYSYYFISLILYKEFIFMLCISLVLCVFSEDKSVASMPSKDGNSSNSCASKVLLFSSFAS